MICIKIRNILIRLLALSICFSLLICSTVLAVAGGPPDEDDPTGTEEPTGTPSSSTLSDQVKKELDDYEKGEGPYTTIQKIADIMVGVAFVIGMFKLVQIGFKAMTGFGKGLQEAKASLIPLLIGVAICVLYFTIGKLIINMLTQDSGTSIFD